MECTVWNWTPHPGYYRNRWDADSLLAHPAYGNYHAQPAQSCPCYDIVALNLTDPATPRVAQQVSMTGTPTPVKTLLDSSEGDTLWAATLSIARPPLSQYPVSRIRPRSSCRVSLLVQALRQQYRSRLVPLHASRIPSPSGLKSMKKWRSGSSITRLCRRSLCE